MVTACSECNARKGSKSLKELPPDMLRGKISPTVPTWADLQRNARHFPPKLMHADWTEWLNLSPEAHTALQRGAAQAAAAAQAEAEATMLRAKAKANAKAAFEQKTGLEGEMRVRSAELAPPPMPTGEDWGI